MCFLLCSCADSAVRMPEAVSQISTADIRAARTTVTVDITSCSHSKSNNKIFSYSGNF